MESSNDPLAHVPDLRKPTINEMAAAHGYPPDLAEFSGWDYAINSDEEDNTQLHGHPISSFEHGYEDADHRFVHRAFRQLREEILNDPPTKATPMLFYALPGTQGKQFKSVQQLGDETARRVEMVRAAGRAWEWNTLFARLKATWRGPRCFWRDPRNYEPDSVYARRKVAGKWVKRGLLDVFTGFYQESFDYNIGLVGIYDLDGETVLPPVEPGPLARQVRLDITEERDSFWQMDIFDLDPDQVEVMGPDNGDKSWIEQTWYRDVSRRDPIEI